MDQASNSTHPSLLLLSITSGTIGAIGMPGNLFLLVLILLEYKKRKPHEWLLFNLALVDFLLCLNNVALEAPFVISPGDRIECKIAGAIDYFLGTLSFFTPPLVAYNRYLSLYDNQKYQRVFTTRNLYLGCGSFVVFAICWITPFVASGSVGHDDMGLCGTQVRYDYLKVIYCGVVLAVCTSYLLLLYFSYKVIVKIRNHKKEATNQSQLQSRLINESQEIMTVMLVMSAVPFYAQIPTALVKLLNIFLPPINPWIVRSLTAPFPLTSALNAYVTIYIVKDYRNKTLSIFKKKSVSSRVVAVEGIPAKVSGRRTTEEGGQATNTV